jgi:hypothetical protein
MPPSLPVEFREMQMFRALAVRTDLLEQAWEVN